MEERVLRIWFDFLRADPFGTTESDRWDNISLRNLKKILRSAGITMPASTSQLSGEVTTLLRGRLLRVLKKPTPWQVWTSTYVAKDSVIATTAELLKNVVPAKETSQPIIAYELSPLLANVFDSLGLTFIDLRISPLRFGDDYLIRFSSNNTQIQQLAAKEERPSDLHKAVGAWRERFCHPETADSWLENVFFLQTKYDASRIDSFGYFNERMFVDLLATRALTGKKVSVKPHPHAEPSTGVKLATTASPLMSWTERNTYELLASSATVIIESLSSSVLEEAVWFGKTPKRWLEPVNRPFASADINSASLRKVLLDSSTDLRAPLPHISLKRALRKRWAN